MRPTSRSRPPIGARRRFRPGLALRRDPRLWWALVIATAAALGLVVAALVARADEMLRAWGSTQGVLVALHDLEPGAEVRPSDVELKEVPRAMVPSSAMTELPTGAVVRASILAGEALVAERLGPVGLSGVAARLPAGATAVAIPVEPGTAPPLEVGDHVDVLVALPREAAGDGPPGFAVVSGALVVAIDDTAVAVAVPRDAAPRVAVALGQGAVTLALVGA